MSLSKRIAITVPGGPAIEDTVKRIAWAETHGIPDVWFSDAGAPDTLTLIAATATHAKTVRVGIAVTPVYTRTPAVLAASAHVIEQLLPGRFILGLGSSSHTIMSQWNGIPLERPLTKVRETTELVRSIMQGEKTRFSGETTSSHGYRQPVLASPPPIYLAALRPKMIELAAELADGVIFNLWPRGALPRMLEHVRIGAERAGKNVQDVEIVNRAMALCTNDKAAGRDYFRRAFAHYYATPVYNEFLAWAGYVDAARTVAEGWHEKDRHKTGSALTDQLIDEIAVIGTADEIRERVREDAANGIHTQIIAPLAAMEIPAEKTFEVFSAENFSF